MDAKAAKRRSKEIDIALQKEQLEKNNRDRKRMSLILLGSGDSGKSTVLKQMKILHGGGFTKENKKFYKNSILENLFDSIRILSIQAKLLKFQILKKNEDTVQLLENSLTTNLVKSVYNDTDDTKEYAKNLAHDINELWRDTGIQQCYNERNKYKLQDTAAYFLNQVKKLMNPLYEPEENDILYVRLKTTSISETTVDINDLKLSIIDVGGQKSLRHFWMPYLEATLGGMIFLVALSSYDQFLEEEPTENRMMDALQLFEGICKIEKVNHLPILLFLNKLDLFEEKIKVSSVKSHFNNFPAHQDEKNLKAGKNFFKSLFLEKNSNKERRIYSHFTSATDTKLMKVIFIAVRDIIYKLNLSNSGLM